MGNFYKVAVKHHSKFLPICNQIFWRRDEENNFVDGYTIAIYTRLMFFPDGWNFNTKSLAKMCGFSLERTRKAISNLKDMGYLIVQQPNNGKFGENVYILIEALDMEVDPILSTFPNLEELETIDISESSPDPENPQTEDPSTAFPNAGNPCTGNPGPLINNNIIINKNNLENKNNLINNFENFSKEKYFVTESSNQLNNNSMDNTHVSQNSATSSLKLPNKIKQKDAALDKSQEKNISQVMAVTDPMNKPKEKKPRKTGTKNTVQKMEEEKGDTVRTVDTQLAHKLSSLTDEDNNLSQLLKIVQEMETMNLTLNKANLSKRKNVNTIQKYIETKKLDKEVESKLKDFVDVKIMKTGPMNKISLDYLLADLQKKSKNDKNLMCVMLKEATKLGWGDFYVTESIEKEAIEKQVEQHVEENNTEEFNEGDYEVIDLFDENGNKIKF